MAEEKPPPFVTFTLSFKGPTIKQHSLKLIVTDCVHVPKALLALKRLVLSAMKTLALEIEGIPLVDLAKSDEDVDTRIDLAEAAFKKHGCDPSARDAAGF